jgi:hypothetical protein
MNGRLPTMDKVSLATPVQGTTGGFHWIKKATAAGTQPAKKFSVIEGKRVLKMLEENGLKPVALEVAPDGGFRFEVAPMGVPVVEAEVNLWDKVL